MPRKIQSKPAKRGAPKKPPTSVIFGRVPVAVAEKIKKIAAKYRVTASKYTGWLLEDAAAGKIKPSHLANR
jgi:hypothetical protein